MATKCNTFLPHQHKANQTLDRSKTSTCKYAFIKTCQYDLYRENRAFQNCSSNRRNLKTPAFQFIGDRKCFGAFRKRWCHHNHYFPDQVFLKHKSKITSDSCVFKFIQGSVDLFLFLQQKYAWKRPKDS